MPARRSRVGCGAGQQHLRRKRGALHGVLAYRFDEALELANRALMVHPNSVFVRNRAAAVYVKCGECHKAIAQCEAACRMNPLDSKKAATVTFTILSFALYMARRFEESIRAGRRALVLTPQSNIARRYVAISLAQLGRTDEARAEIAELLKHQPGASLAAVQQQAFFRHQWMKELQMEGLRKAGLREDSQPNPRASIVCCGAASIPDAERPLVELIGASASRAGNHVPTEAPCKQTKYQGLRRPGRRFGGLSTRETDHERERSPLR
jgi:tetratricopeptide (TPR) repeat protein